MIIGAHIKYTYSILIYTWICAHFIVQESATYTYSEVKKGANLPEENPTQVRTHFLTLTVLIKAREMDHTVGRCLLQTMQQLVPKL